MIKDPEEVREMATAHVGWYLESIRPLLIDHMKHGYKHGVQDATGNAIYTEISWRNLWKRLWSRSTRSGR